MANITIKYFKSLPQSANATYTEYALLNSVSLRAKKMDKAFMRRYYGAACKDIIYRVQASEYGPLWVYGTWMDRTDSYVWDVIQCNRSYPALVDGNYSHIIVTAS